MPTLAHTLVDAAGQEHRRLRVFCRRVGHSVDLARCLQCPVFAELVEGGAGASSCVRCRAAGEPNTGELTNVLGRAALVCVRPDLPAAELGRIFERSRAPFLLVLDYEDRAVGLVWPTAVAHVTKPLAFADDLMTTVHLASEKASLAEVLHEMAAGHLRWLPVMACDGAPIGALRDVEALRAWAQRARSTRSMTTPVPSKSKEESKR